MLQLLMRFFFFFLALPSEEPFFLFELLYFLSDDLGADSHVLPVLRGKA
jgi:hypothetical protein